MKYIKTKWGKKYIFLIQNLPYCQYHIQNLASFDFGGAATSEMKVAPHSDTVTVTVNILVLSVGFNQFWDTKSLNIGSYQYVTKMILR